MTTGRSIPCATQDRARPVRAHGKEGQGSRREARGTGDRPRRPRGLGRRNRSVRTNPEGRGARARNVGREQKEERAGAGSLHAVDEPAVLLAEAGQQVPVVVVTAGESNRHVLVDGFKRVRALQRLGRDTVRAMVWDLSEAEALLLERLMRSGDGAGALEEGSGGVALQLGASNRCGAGIPEPRRVLTGLGAVVVTGVARFVAFSARRGCPRREKEGGKVTPAGISGCGAASSRAFPCCSRPLGEQLVAPIAAAAAARDGNLEFGRPHRRRRHPTRRASVYHG